MSSYIELPQHFVDQKYFDQIINVLKSGGIAIYPTDSVYAMGCLSNQQQATNKLGLIKNQKIERAELSFIFSDIKQLTDYIGIITNPQHKVIKRNSPGPITFILEPKNKLPKPFNKRKTIGARIPNHPFLLELISKLEAPILTASLYNEDEIVTYSTDPNEIYQIWDADSRIDLFVNGGYGNNIPSTVVDLTSEPFQMMRQGLGEFR
ncbi:MAG: L-threonylcarbamoyladenylate synthase [Flavobacteriaceae bacterium]|nr:L-threonylcarbamoyladenylate synthase [Flavobacteriaceae bacterium]MCY4215520.1 L-threonylcarbamoyladenylate synthase [Flavobacteriaceae bacterium]